MPFTEIPAGSRDGTVTWKPELEGSAAPLAPPQPQPMAQKWETYSAYMLLLGFFKPELLSLIADYKLPLNYLESQDGYRGGSWIQLRFSL